MKKELMTKNIQFLANQSQKESLKGKQKRRKLLFYQTKLNIIINQFIDYKIAYMEIGFDFKMSINSQLIYYLHSIQQIQKLIILFKKCDWQSQNKYNSKAMSRRGQSEGRRYSTKDSHYVNKPLLKTIYKNRTNNSTVDERWNKTPNINPNNSLRISNPDDSLAFRSHQINNNDCELDRALNSTQNKLFNANFNHHNPALCVCDSCNCGRHLCKLHAIAPDMTKSSIYRDSFRNKGLAPSFVLKTDDAPKLKGNHLDLASINRKDFSGRKGDGTERPKPEDLLKTGGPSQHLTTYSSGFPGFKGSNQYVKPTDNMIRGNFPIKSQTTYGKSFSQRPGRKADLSRSPDNLKAGPIWFGQTTYSSKFYIPNPQDYAAKIKIAPKLEVDPKYTHQYETVYKNDFLSTQRTVCPAKEKLETKVKGSMSGSKNKFAENMDFKALSPDFHALSLSKQSFV